MEGCASSYHFEILNYFNPELQFVDTESAIKNKLIDLFSDLQNCGNTSFRVYKQKSAVLIKQNMTSYIRT